MKKIDCVTIGGATRDIIFKTDDYSFNLEDKKELYMCFSYGQKIIPSETHFTFGGGALNSAVSMSRLGLNVSSIINAGNHEASSSLVRKMKDEKIDTKMIMTSNKKNDYRGITVLLVDKGKDHTAILYRGTNDKIMIKDWSFLNKTDWIYVTSLTGDSDKCLNSLEDKINKSGVKFAWNPGSVQLKKGYSGLKKLIKMTDVFILNKEEAENLACSKNKNLSCTLGDVTSEIKSWGAKAVVVTDGSNGAQVAFDGELVRVKSYPAKVSDTTGAGDAFGSTFVAGIIMGMSHENALKLASINSASVVSYFGAQEGLLKKADILKKLKNYKQ
ncbi:carbohydrate kinase family protein [bacterium]|nr:carbohydrate kinase family protein [bacterium]